MKRRRARKRFLPPKPALIASPRDLLIAAAYSKEFWASVAFLVTIVVCVQVIVPIFKQELYELGWTTASKKARADAEEDHRRAEQVARDQQNARDAAEREARIKEYESRPLSERFAVISPTNTTKGTVLYHRISGKRALVVERDSNGVSLIPEDTLRTYTNGMEEDRIRGTVDTFTWENVNQLYTRIRK